MFSAETYIERRKLLKKKVGSGILLFPGNNESPMNYADNTYHFRQDSTFLYFFGLSVPSLAAVIDIDNDTEVIFGDELTMDMIVWMGNQPTLADQSARVGIQTVKPFAELTKILKKAREQKREIHFLPAYRYDNQILLHQLLGLTFEEIATKSSVEFIKAVVAQREIKSSEELVEIEKAVNVSVDMHIAAIRFARPGMTEAEVAAEMHRVALASGGDLSFPIIATINGQTLHNHYHGNRISEGDLFLCDAGAETPMGYAGDLSSTFPVSKRFSEKQKEIYKITLEAHLAAIDKLAPGIPFMEVHLTAARTIVDGLKGLGLMKGNTEEAVASGAHALFLPCGTGHMMGLDVHDMENLGEVYVGYGGNPKSTQFGLKSLRLAKPLKQGFVVTIEPGIYFIPELMDLWQKDGTNAEFLNFDAIDTYRDFGGIRNEEDVLITEKGARVLGKTCPKTIEEVEALRI